MPLKHRFLTYNAEVWGAYEKFDFVKWDKSAIEKVHLRYCKSYLGINRKSSMIWQLEANLEDFALKP